MYHSMGLEKRKFPIFLIRNFILGLINPLNAKLNPICHLLALLGAHPILHVGRIRVNLVHFVMLMLLYNRLMHLEMMGWFKLLIFYNVVEEILLQG